MDTLWNCTYGIDINVQNKPNNEYFKASEKIFSDAFKFKFLKILSSIKQIIFVIFLIFIFKFIFSVLFPELDSLWIFLSTFQNGIKKFFGFGKI